MPKFRRKPEIVEAVEVADRGLWIVRSSNGDSTEVPTELFNALYERVSDNYRVAPLALEPEIS